MLIQMRPGDEHTFSADDPVARYWLHNCVGFGVRGLAGGGVVHEIGLGTDGVAVLAVRRTRARGDDGRAGIAGSVGRSLGRDRRPALAQPRDAGAPRGPGPRRRRRVATAARGAAVADGVRCEVVPRGRARGFCSCSPRSTRKHAPGARRAAATLGILGRAYAVEAARACREQKDAVARVARGATARCVGRRGAAHACGRRRSRRPHGRRSAALAKRRAGRRGSRRRARSAR